MPSRKVVSILIICFALVFSIILVFGDKKVASTLTGGLVSSGPEISLPTNNSWKADISSLSLSREEASSVQASSTGNVTEEVSQSLMGNYLALKQSGKLNSDSASKLVDQASTLAEVTVANVYSSSDILISPDNSAGAVRIYGSALGTALKINIDQYKDSDEMLVFKNMLEKKNPQDAAILKELGGVYQRTAESLSKIKVPSSYLGMHLQMVNKIHNVGSSLAYMSLLLEDPLTGLAAVEDYQKNLGEMLGAMNAIKSKILQDGVVYKQGESGYYFYYGI